MIELETVWLNIFDKRINAADSAALIQRCIDILKTNKKFLYEAIIIEEDRNEIVFEIENSNDLLNVGPAILRLFKLEIQMITIMRTFVVAND